MTTKCHKCGTQLDNIERPEPQTCRCELITAFNGRVRTNTPKPPEEQPSLFEFRPATSYPE